MAKLPNIYLDYNATVPPRPEAVAIAHELSAEPLNASSVHGAGRKAKHIIEDARSVIAEHVSCFPGEVIFTSSGTESNAMALQSYPKRQLLVAATEHPSVLKQRDNTIELAVHANGLLDMDAFEQELKSVGEGEALVSVMFANNETGVIQPIAEISALARKYGAIMHCDAMQAIGKIPVDIGVLGVDMLTLCAHKCGGVVGAAALVAREGVVPTPIMRGGGQELRRRAGTENIPSIAAFAAAITCAEKDEWQFELRGWLDALESVCEAAGGVVLGKDATRLPNASNIMMPNKSAELQLIHFDLANIAVSAGSACSSGRVEASHVARAMLGDDAEGLSNIIRISGGWNTQESDIIAAQKAWLSFAKR